MITVGRVCVKIAGRDAGKKAVVVENLSNYLVLIDGETRRRKCNIRHLEPLELTVDIKKGASQKEVEAALKKHKIGILQTKPKKATKRPKKVRKVKVKAPAVVKKNKEEAKVKKTETKQPKVLKKEAKVKEPEAKEEKKK